MDIFVERIIERKKNIIDYMVIFSIFFGSLFVALLIILFFNINAISAALLIALGYLVYYLISMRNVEFEYAFTNGELDIDKIIAQRKRKRLFSANCRDFEAFGKLDSKNFTDDIKNIPQQIKAVTSMSSQDVYFLVANYKGNRTLVYFEPDERMLNSLKPYISKRITM
ncbi:DUF6106 family protein [Acetivibrio saccincola]|jgi:hypothetical protein|uniref:Uncharacterized protein n=1 Tax=Acetivibrio saccincola TaxID=1677857 RepID=A0A2K9EI79_9FIRM|nr:DUF6106 family protein [Acetivibrio saccincola]AUG58935.1 hypothetical protein HVS_15470 [Acetivibrio saccincola]NLW26940.1 hypothetical protein [Acetivibrio saccincola]PQQ65985.1 hypothetical protein B9R14_03855 [Acetivibrio saccincola]HOA96371.1 DUF6106 family protein [Acetivibrio saccincola]HQD28865.1 DUF6106 family protein [Acetivibrio saccincola]